jgi:UPF0755 protein
MKTKIIILSIALAATLLFGSYYFIFQIPNTAFANAEYSISVRDTLTIDEFLSNHNSSISNPTSFKIACALKRVKRIKPGRYSFSTGMNNKAIIDHLRSGGIAVVQVRIDDAGDIYELAGKLGQTLLNDSATFIQTLLAPSLLQELNTDSARLACFVVPNTYEFYWNMTPRAFVDRMLKESQRIWNANRKAEAAAQGLSEQEVVILASIVKAETANPEEAPRIAGLYLNRLRTGMPLQSDPTATFGKKDKSRRVYLSDLQTENPYNTYKIVGLPPGPINFPELVYIDAVLHAEKNNYIYMCAQPGGTGRHNFCASYSEHEKNRRLYIQWLESKGIR